MSRGCEHAIEYVYHYLDHELTWSRRTRIRWHLSRCSGCCGAFDFEERLKAVIRERGRDEPPPELFERLRALIHEEAAGNDAP
jgi:mycothiol system anti-sigma-R factor